MKVDVCVPTIQKPSSEFEAMIVRELPVNDILYSYAKPLGTARQELIDRVSTEWFVFVDTDVDLLPGWFPAVWKMVDDRTGAVDGMWSYTIQPEVDAYWRAMRSLAQHLGRRTAVEMTIRAFTGDTLVRTELVKDIRIPPVPVYEDEFIKMHIQAKGYSWKRTPDIVCLHNRRLNVEQAWIAGYYAYYFKRMSAGQAVKNLLTIFPKSIYAAADSGMLRIIPMQVERELKTSLGCLAACLKHDSYQPALNK
jgi:hypothetical protein